MWNFFFALLSWFQKDIHTLAWISLVSLQISTQTNEHILNQQRVYKSSVFWKMFERYCGFFHLQKPYCYFPFHICYSFEWLPNNSLSKGAKVLPLIILKYLLPLLLNKRSLVHRKVHSYMWTHIQILNYKSLVLVNPILWNKVHWQVGNWGVAFSSAYHLCNYH